MEESRIVIYDKEIHLDVYEAVEVGDTIPVFRGNGPREGERMGTATVTGFEGSSPMLEIKFMRVI
jgi:hypothetical protein